ncbi:insulinase family protein [Pseudomonas sp. S75]|uniref:M16 family metallopeptidase n=1 Tax=unclassified Pseudomonas TaxID=196821 RepID=UPI001903DDF4|nr:MULTISPECIES: M16 family metallopeptidase [unclassified Pseudomonas]MBJ9974436.1 insulinase family protein [Pseudomonas sp. S30]MBK0154255.1 insulinase family protein [Pseudomonas sp. S75]
MKTLLAGLLGPLLLGACAALPEPDSPLPWDAQVTQGTLANGMHYRLVRETAQPGRLDLRMTINAGSVDEADDQVGVAHLVEHLVFHSHAGHNENLRARMVGLGWVQGRHFNAVTNYERTQYMLSPPTGTRQAPQALQVLADMAFSRDYSAADLERERPIVIEEWRGGLGVAQRMNEQRTASQRVGSRYPAHRTIGNEAAIRNASLASLKAFQATWYQPSNMVISAVGDFEPTAMLAQIEAVFGKTQAGTTPQRDHRDLPLDDHLKIFRLQDPQSGSNQVSLLLRLHEPDSRGTTRAALRERLIDRMTLAALVDSLRRQPRQPGVRSLTAQKTLIGSQSTVLGIAAGVEDLQHEQALRQLLTEIERLRQHGFSAQDFANESAHIRALGDKTLANQTPRTFEQWVEQLNNATAPDARVVERQAAARRYLEVLPSIERKDLDDRLRLWLGSADRVLQFSVPGQAQVELPSVAAVEALQAAIARQALSAPVQQQVDAPVTATYTPAAPAPAGQIVARKAFAAEQVEHWTLGNGDRLVWLRRNGPDGNWLLQADSSAGYHQAGVPAWRLQMAAQLAVRSGPQGALAWRQAQRATLGLEHQPQRLQLNLSGAPQQLPALLQSYRLSQQAEIDSTSFEQARSDLLQRVRSRPEDVRSRQESELRALKYGADDWPMPEPIALQQLDRAQLQADWQRLTRAPVTYYLMADVAADQLEPLVRSYLANVPRGAAPAAHAALQRPGARRSDLAIAPEPRAVLQASSFQPLAWQPQAAMRVALLRELANQRLKQRLRGEASGVYRLSFDAQLDPDSQRIESTLSFTCDPARVDELWALAQRTLAELSVDEAWLLSQRRELERQEARRRADPQTQFKRLILSERHWQDPRYLSEQATLPQALTLPAMQRLARQLFPAANQVQLRLLPSPAALEQAL